MYLTKKELLFLTYHLNGWGDAGFSDFEIWNFLSPEQLDKIQWLFDGKESLEKKLKKAGYNQGKVIDTMELPNEIKDIIR